MLFRLLISRFLKRAAAEDGALRKPLTNQDHVKQISQPLVELVNQELTGDQEEEAEVELGCDPDIPEGTMKDRDESNQALQIVHEEEEQDGDGLERD